MSGLQRLIFLPVLLIMWAAQAQAADTSSEFYEPDDVRVKLTDTLPYVDVQHAGKTVRILRRQDAGNVIAPAYARTSRECPPFCIQPATLHAQVATIEELELIDYLRRISAGDSSVRVIDSRTEQWRQMGTIPGSVSVPWTELSPAKSSTESIAEILQFEFDVARDGELWDFSNAKTLVFFCNGAWCNQSPTHIANLLRMGYPPEKLKWYRGGMQAWEMLGLTTVTDE